MWQRKPVGISLLTEIPKKTAPNGPLPTTSPKRWRLPVESVVYNQQATPMFGAGLSANYQPPSLEDGSLGHAVMGAFQCRTMTMTKCSKKIPEKWCYWEAKKWIWALSPSHFLIQHYWKKTETNSSTNANKEPKKPRNNETNTQANKSNLSKQAIKQAIKQANKQASLQASKQKSNTKKNKQANKEQESKHKANKQTNQQANKETNKRTSH